MTRSMRTGGRGALAATGGLVALLGALALLLAVAPRADAYVYWSSAFGSITRTQNDGSGADGAFVAGLGNGVYGVAVDDRHLWWANLSTRRIGRAARDGSDADAAFIDTGGQAQDVVTDGEHVWWASGGTIGRARRDGSGVTHGFIAAGGATMLALDDEYVYWTRSSADAIGRARLDGSDVNPSFVVGADAPIGIAVDGEHLYWVNGGPANSIGRARRDGSDVNQSFITGLVAGAGLTVDATHLYWINQASNRVGRAGRDGSGVNQSFSSQGNAMNDVAVDGLPVTPTLSGTRMHDGSVLVGEEPFRLRIRLDGGSHPTGTLTARLYGPGNDVCGGLPLHEQTIPVTGNGDYTAEFTPALAGDYRWQVVYIGDDANRSLWSGACGLGGVFTAEKRLWSLRAGAPSPEAVAGEPLSAQATLGAPVCFTGRAGKTWDRGWGCFAGPRAGGGVRGAAAADAAAPADARAAAGGDAPGGGAAPRAAGDPDASVVFRLYGPGDDSCSLAPVFEDAVGVSAAVGRTARSGAFVPRAAGAYRWTAEYTGDAANEATVAVCAEATVVEVVKAEPALALTATPRQATAGDALDATAELTGGFEPAGELTFALHGPGDEQCTAAPVHVVRAAVGDPIVRATPYVATAAGTYRWVVSYAGDGANAPAATGCGDAGAAVVVVARPVDPGPPPPPPPVDPPPAPPVDPPPAPPARPAPALSGFTLAGRCTRPAARGAVAVGLRLRMAQTGTVQVRVERALGTRGLARCPKANPTARFGGRFRTVATKRSVKTAAAAAGAGRTAERWLSVPEEPVQKANAPAASTSAAALARTVTLRLRLEPALYRITVRTRTADGTLSAPRSRFLRVLSPRG